MLHPRATRFEDKKAHGITRDDKLLINLIPSKDFPIATGKYFM